MTKEADIKTASKKAAFEKEIQTVFDQRQEIMAMVFKALTPKR